MKAIYEPRGKAKEYGNLACNLYRGCGHGCTYCYAPTILRMDRQEFYNNPQPREGIIEALKRDAKRIGDKYKKKLIEYDKLLDKEMTFKDGWLDLGETPEKELEKIDFIKSLQLEQPEVFLCFTTDPYQRVNDKYQLTRQAIEILHANEIAVNILTKGAITDFDLLARRPDLSKVGVTFDGTELFSKRLIRTKNLTLAKSKGISTWISFEPVIKPESVLSDIKHIGKYADEIKLGKWNYDPRAKDIDWHKFVNEAIELLERLNCKYYIKEDLRKYV